MTDQFDAVVIGMGPGGEVVADRLLRAARRVAVVEQELIGGECAYWACIPSKSVLRPPEAAVAAERALGGGGGGPEWSRVRDHRDWMVRHLDDQRRSTATARRARRSSGARPGSPGRARSA